MTELLTITTTIAGIALVGLLALSWSHWKLLAYVRGIETVVQEKATPARLAECETLVKAFGGRIDTFAVENQTFREAVHKSMQRFDQIMRRNERALIDKASKILPQEEEKEYPDVIPLGTHTPPMKPVEQSSREELRKKLFKQGRL